MKQGAVIALLGWNAVRDVKCREISLFSVVVFGIVGIIWGVADHSLGILHLISFGIGLLFLFFSILTAGKIGMGDAWILLTAGTLMPAEEYLVMLMLGLLLASAWSGYLLIFRKKGRNTEIPFLPFLLLGYLGGICIC